MRYLRPNMKMQQDGLGAAHDARILRQLARRLRADLAFDVTDASPIVTGYPNNNRLWRLRAADGRRAVAKRYYRDDRNRLGREFGTLRFLHARGRARIPSPLLRCDDLEAAVYSDEPGVTLSATDLTAGAMTELGRFAAELHAITPEECGEKFPPSVAASFSYPEKMAAIRQRLHAFSAAAAQADAPAAVRELCAEQDIAGTVERLLERAVAGLDGVALGAVIPPHERRLDSGDFAPHNVLTRADGSVCVLDFEYAGWNRPLASLAGFLTAATALDLRPEQTAAFLQAFRDAADGSDEAFAEFPRLCALDHIFWCTVHLSITTPAHLARKRFANLDLDANAVITDQIAQFKRRLRLTEEAVAPLSSDPGDESPG